MRWQIVQVWPFARCAVAALAALVASGQFGCSALPGQDSKSVPNTEFVDADGTAGSDGGSGDGAGADLPAAPGDASDSSTPPGSIPCFHNKNGCFTAGRCWLDPKYPATGMCVALSDKDCAQSEVCKNLGSCWRIGDKCGIPAGPHCADSTVCKLFGRCGSGNTLCEPTTEAHCLASTACADNGACALAEFKESNGVIRHNCLVPPTFDCTKSKDCKQVGWCFYYAANGSTAPAGTCSGITDDASCAASEMCKYSGLCASVGSGQSCTAKSDAHCAASQECAERGYCVRNSETSYCELPLKEGCLNKPACLLEGACSLSDKQMRLCLIAGDSDCAQSQACKKEGRCLFSDRYLRCEATIDPWPPNW